MGYVPLSKEGAELLFQVLAERHEKKSVIITTNPGFGDWIQIFGDPTLIAALLDRITHKARVINCSWESYRVKGMLKKKQAVQARQESLIYEQYLPGLADRYERGSVMITSNLPLSKWEQVFKDQMLTAAAIDRLMHHSVILELDIESYRMEAAMKNKSKTPDGSAKGSK